VIRPAKVETASEKAAQREVLKHSIQYLPYIFLCMKIPSFKVKRTNYVTKNIDKMLKAP